MADNDTRSRAESKTTQTSTDKGTQTLQTGDSRKPAGKPSGGSKPNLAQRRWATSLRNKFSHLLTNY